MRIKAVLVLAFFRETLLPAFHVLGLLERAPAVVAD